MPGREMSSVAAAIFDALVIGTGQAGPALSATLAKARSAPIRSPKSASSLITSGWNVPGFGGTQVFGHGHDAHLNIGTVLEPRSPPWHKGGGWNSSSMFVFAGLSNADRRAPVMRPTNSAKLARTGQQGSGGPF
jgi:hypothetical protein